MDSIYLNVGKIISLIQNWENQFKNFTIKNHIEKSDDKRSLSNMNSFLFREKIINEKQYLLIKRVIEIRNYIIHRLFLELNDENVEQINSYLIDAEKIIAQTKEMLK